MTPSRVDPWTRIERLVLDGVTSVHSKRVYGQALNDFARWCREAAASGFTRATVQAYRASLEAGGLAASSINVKLSALRKLAAEASDNGLLASDVAAAILRVKSARRHGVRAGNWLSLAQTERLLDLPDRTTHRGIRDRALLALLTGCGLRRQELAALRLEDIQEREGRWCIVDLAGKGNRVRTIPMPQWTKSAVDTWLTIAGFERGPVLGTVNRGGRITGQGMSAQSIYDVVCMYGRQLGISLAPHDVRRTFAKLAYKGQARLDQIQISLGHASIQTTERYLGTTQDLVDAPCDHLGIGALKGD